MRQPTPVPTADEVFNALQKTFDVRGRTAGLIDIRRSRTDADTAVLVFRWPPEDRLFGVPVSLTRIERRLGWDQPAPDLDDWLDSVDLWIMEEVSNGFRHRGRRRAVDDYIELTKPSWPDDQRFHLQVNGHIDTDTTILEDLAVAGLDARAALGAQDAGTLLAWTFAYENNSIGMPIVGHSTIIRDSSETARLVDVVLGVDVPATVAVELVRAATHAAAEAGARAVDAPETLAFDLRRLHPDVCRITGFRPGPAGLRVDTNFLTEDAALASSLLQAELVHPGRWGDDRDRAGRHIPNSRARRFLHRLRYGKAGTPPRVYAG